MLKLKEAIIDKIIDVTTKSWDILMIVVFTVILLSVWFLIAAFFAAIAN